MKNPLVLGAAGQLGTELVRLLGAAAGVTRDQLSITDASAVDALIGARRPDVVFNCAAYNSVDRAEAEPDVALAVNRDGAFNVASSSARHGARLVHFSTNFVFDGSLERPYVESDEARPLGAYGLSKLAGEQRVVAADPGALVIRTAAVYGHRGRGFPDRILERARARGEVEVVADQSVNPTSAADLAAASIELAESGQTGVLHVVGGGCCAWETFARAVLEELAVQARVSPLTSAQLASPARRPRNGCMASERVPGLRQWREALHDWAKRM